MADIVALSALVVAVIGALGSLLSHLHIKKVKVLGCIESDCRAGDTPSTPTASTHI
jgi:hypothetical protein